MASLCCVGAGLPHGLEDGPEQGKAADIQLSLLVAASQAREMALDLLADAADVKRHAEEVAAECWL